jgi:hypothetical protein
MTRTLRLALSAVGIVLSACSGQTVNPLSPQVAAGRTVVGPLPGSSLLVRQLQEAQDSADTHGQLLTAVSGTRDGNRERDGYRGTGHRSARGIRFLR